MIRFRCDGCGKTIKAPDEYAGKKCKCPSCGDILAIPVTQSVDPLKISETVPTPTPRRSETDIGSMSETPPMPEPVEDEWFYHVGGNKFGPVSSESIIANLKRGELNSATKVWRQGMDAWTAIGATPEFGAICSQVPAVNASHLPPEPPQTPTVPSQITYDTTTDTFSGSIQAILRLAAKAITACKYKIDNANETLALITFQTGVTWGSWSGVSCSIAFEEVGSHAYKANCSGKQNLRGGQLLAINLGGEAKGKALKVVRKMIELL